MSATRRHLNQKPARRGRKIQAERYKERFSYAREDIPCPQTEGSAISSAARASRTGRAPLRQYQLRAIPHPKDVNWQLTHVARVRGRAVHSLRTEMAAAPQDLRHDRILVPEPSISSPKYARATRSDAHLKVRQRHAELGVMRLAEEEVPEPQPLCLLLQVRDDGDDRLPLRLESSAFLFADSQLATGLLFLALRLRETRLCLGELTKVASAGRIGIRGREASKQSLEELLGVGELLLSGGMLLLKGGVRFAKRLDARAFLGKRLTQLEVMVSRLL